MAITVLDSTDTAGILADAGVKLDPVPAVEAKPDAGKAAENAAAAPAVYEDEEDENGLTAAEREGLTERMKKAIGKRHREKREAEEFAAAQFNEKQLALQRAEKLERELNELKGKLQPKEQVSAEPEPPQRQNFASEADYVDAMIQYGVDKRLAEKAREDQEARQRREAEERLETAKSRILRAVELQPDFEEVVGAVDTQLSPAIGTYLEESEMVGELTYYLAKNPDVLESLLKLSPHSQLVKIGKIESTLTPFGSNQTQNDSKSSEAEPDGRASKPAPSKDTDIDLSKPRSKPAPVFSPLDATGSAGTSKNPDSMNTREMIEEYAKRNRVNLGARKRH